MSDIGNSKRVLHKQDCLSLYQAKLMSVRNRDDITLCYVVKQQYDVVATSLLVANDAKS